MEDSRTNIRPIITSTRTNREHERPSRATVKVTDHPWLASSTPSYPDLSPSPSTEIAYTQSSSQSKYDWRMHSLMLSKHILQRGLIDGIGSDIQVTVPVWQKTYHLHRLVLDQNPYFKLLLQGDFKESEADSITLHFEQNENYITVDSFQFVLEYLYGKIEEPQITADNVREIFATCSYFQLDICGICVDFILKNLNHQNVVDYLLFTNEFMVQGSDRICDAIFTFLCREAYSMSRSVLTSLPLDWLKKVIESDAFWVPSEYDRYQFIKEIIEARYNIHKTSSDFILTELDTNSNCQIMTKCIYYMHMSFEQLELIEKDINPFTNQPLVSPKVLKEALWSQIKLRSKIESSLERQSTLDLTLPATLVKTMIQEKKKKSSSDEQEEPDSDSEESISSKFYPIPTDDTTTYTGESAISLAFSSHKKSGPNVEQYSTYPPFRFSVEFSEFTSLKHGIRVYSDTVFYAGSNWNMYIQKTRSQRKGVLQLGVYLHRQSIPQNHNPCHTEENQEYTRTSTPDAWSFSRYADRRKVVKTWFKIYCPTRGPKHALTLFQSSPDNFSVLQSWGWRSTTLCADEESTPPPEDSTETPLIYPSHSSSIVQYLQSTYDLRTLKSALNTSPEQQNKPQSTNSSLRFTVVMGHV